jgi:mannosyltransferase OCH1-like enzyme
VIPKIIHCTYKTSDLPENLAVWFEKAKQLHPGWEFRLWTDVDNLNLVKSHFPEMLAPYEALPYNIMRVDIVRYMYMKVYGGVYIDLDYELLMPLDPLLNHDLILPLSRENGKRNYKHGVIIGNCVFASIPGHPFWTDVLDDFYKNPPIEYFSDKKKIVHLTGPDFITGIYFRNPEKYQAYLPKKIAFHPDLHYAEKNYDKVVESKETYGIHHCEGSWLKSGNSMDNLALRAVGWMKRKMRDIPPFSFMASR